MPTRTASASWRGNLTDGSGTLRTGQGGYEGNYSYKSRFEAGEGTNPEELIGAAHAGCYSMALAKGLSEAGFTPNSVDTTAEVEFTKTEAGMTITRIHLDTVVDAPGIEPAEFRRQAEAAKNNCPVSRLLAPGTDIILSASLA